MIQRTRDRRKRILGAVAATIAAGVMVSGILTGCSASPEPDPVQVSQPAETQPPATAAEVTAEPTAEPTTRAQVMLPDMAQLYAENNEIAGWIQIEGTAIDYPVMFTPQDGQFYLYRNFEKEDDPTQEGCLFIDEHCTIDPRSTNLLIHGHNMKNGSMFHSLINYKDESYYKEHPIINYKTLYEDQEYEIAYVFLSKVYNKDDDVWKFYKFYNAADAQQYDEFTAHCKELELYDTGVTANYDDDLITLTTCEYSTDNGRMVVVARRVTEEAPLQGEAAKALASEQQQVVEGDLTGAGTAADTDNPDGTEPDADEAGDEG